MSTVYRCATSSKLKVEKASAMFYMTHSVYCIACVHYSTQARQTEERWSDRKIANYTESN